MLQYKNIHTNSGFESLYSTKDVMVQSDINSYIEQLSAISSLENQNVYAYLYDGRYGIYFKRKNQNITALFDVNNQFQEYDNSYCIDVVLDERMIVVDNLQSTIYDKEVKPIRPFAILINDGLLPHAIKVLDAILQNKRVAIVGDNVDSLKKIIKYVLYLLPSTYANKVGFVINCEYIPNLSSQIFDHVKIFGLTEECDFFAVDEVVKLHEEVNEENKTAYAKYLAMNNLSCNLMLSESKKMANLFSKNTYDDKSARVMLSYPLFERNQNLENALVVLEAFSSLENKVDSSQFKKVVDYLTSTKNYTKDIENKVNLIIKKNPHLSSFELSLKEQSVTSKLVTISKLTKVEIEEIVSYFVNDNVHFTEEQRNILIEQKCSNTYEILFNVVMKSTDECKCGIIMDFLSVDRTYDLKIENIRFDEFILNKIFSLPKQYISSLLARFLYSTVLNRFKEKGYSKQRKAETITKFMAFKKDIKDVEILLDTYVTIKSLIEKYLPQDVIDYHDFELFTSEQLSEIIRLNRRTRQTLEKDYYDILNFVNNFECRAYPDLQNKVVDIILGKDIDGSPYYKKLINVHNLSAFEGFFKSTNIEMSEDVLNFITSLKTEKETSEVLEYYRIDFVYNTYITAAKVVREKIANRLGVPLDKNMDEAIKNIIEARGDKALYQKRKEAIDVIIDLVKKDDEIRLGGKNLSTSHILVIFILSILATIIALALFASPSILRASLLKIDFLETFYAEYNLATPVVMLYSFAFVNIKYFINLSKTRGYTKQARTVTILDWLIYVMIPIFVYALAHILIYLLG